MRLNFILKRSGQRAVAKFSIIHYRQENGRDRDGYLEGPKGEKYWIRLNDTVEHF